MTSAADSLSRSAGVLPLPLVAVGSALIWFALLQVMVLVQTGGAFEYPLDDVYIHLAMANSIARGEYGVNPGELSSAASSALYPVLLAPFTGTGFERLMPLAINTAALAALALGFGQMVLRSGLTGGAALLVAALGPIALNMPGVALTGMEHTLHAALSIGVLLGLFRYFDTGRIGWLPIACMIIGPLVRFEGLAVSAMAGMVLMFTGRPGAAVGLGIAAILPVLGFAFWLNSLGIGPLPNSVTAKMTASQVTGLGAGIALLVGLIVNLREPPAWPMLVLALALPLVGVLHPHWRKRPERVLAIALGLAALGHLLVAKIGWAHRYEHYLLVLLAAAALIILAPMPRLRIALLWVMLGVLGLYYNYDVLRNGPASAAALRLQQVQMARFAQDFVQAPVAVNDIGRVVWRNPDYVLDLWGLASRTALETRMSGQAGGGWADPLVAAHNVPLAMIYDDWLDEAIGTGWVHLGNLTLTGDEHWLALPSVAFYATSAAEAPKLRADLARFVPTLPQGVTFENSEASR